MILFQDRKWFFDQGSFVERVALVQVLPYVYCMESEMGDKFPTCIGGHFTEEFKNIYAYALCNSFLGW